MNRKTFCFAFGIVFLTTVVVQFLAHNFHPLHAQERDSYNPLIKDDKLKVELVFDGTEVSSDINNTTSMAFIDNKTIIFLQKNDGKVRILEDGALQGPALLDLSVNSSGSRGLLGLAILEPQTEEKIMVPAQTIKRFVYLYFTEAVVDGDRVIGNHLYRFEWDGNSLVRPRLLLELEANYPGHNGGKLAEGNDSSIYLIFGDQGKNSIFQNANKSDLSYTGVIFHLDRDGMPHRYNPYYNFTGDRMVQKIFAHGIRNSFGVAVDPVTGNLWDTENGGKMYDEINIVPPGFNSGWQKVMGPINSTKITMRDLVKIGDSSRYLDPVLSWRNQIGITDIEFFGSDRLGRKYHNGIFIGDINNGNIYYFGLNKGRNDVDLLELNLADSVIDSHEMEKIVFGKDFGGITDLVTGPDGFLYILTIDGKIIRIVPSDLEEIT
jgi:glucose/arabinose dehydrogenase